MDNSENVHGEHVKREPLKPEHLHEAIQPAPVAGAATFSDLHGDAERPAGFGAWLAQNGITLMIVGAALVYIYLNFDVDGMWAIAKAALGLSFVIFIHELGHFLVAKWCNVNVTTFSIGFGPALPGCSFQWGETTYKLALFPLGGYVQMVGQVDGDEGSDGSEDDPRSYRKKSVFQRMAIISAGVIMNAILAVVCFIIVFMIPGKDRKAAVINTIDPGLPAARYDIHTGSAVLQVGDVKNPYFENLMTRVMATQPGQSILFITKRSEDPQPIESNIIPESRPTGRMPARPVIGISTPPRLQLLPESYLRDAVDKVAAVPGSPASLAVPPLAADDVIIGMTDPSNPSEITPLPLDPRSKDIEQCDYFEFARRLELLAGQPVSLVVLPARDKDTDYTVVTIPPAFRYTLGVQMAMGPVAMVRKNSPADKAGVLAGSLPRLEDKKDGAENRWLKDFVPGDFIEGVEVTEPDGKKVHYQHQDDTLDPERLPLQLRQWADRMDKAGQPKPWKVTLNLRRENKAGPQLNAPQTVTLDWDHSWRFDRVLPISKTSSLAIPELGLAYYVKNVVKKVVTPPAPEEPIGKLVESFRNVIKQVLPQVHFHDNRLQANDKIVGVSVLLAPFKTTKGEKEHGAVIAGGKIDLKDDQWAGISHGISEHSIGQIRQFKLTVERVEMESEKPIMRRLILTVKPTLDTAWPITARDRGVFLIDDVRRQKADNILDATALGFSDTWDMIQQVYWNLRGMFSGQISVENLGGPVAIAEVAYRIAGNDVWEFIFFLGMISINLAVINFLPIPVLDGGHMVFLIYEKLRGKPASEGIRVAATYAGLAMILTLMVFVLYLDISRIIRG